MPLHSLFLQNLRCFDEARVDLCPGLNLLAGANGTGKTTILEGIDILSRGSSFRTRYKSDLIRTSCEHLQLGAKINDGSIQHTLSVRKSMADGTEALLDNTPLAGMAEAARVFPVKVFHPGSHLLIHGGASERRRFMDWGVFHVKQEFFTAWRKYQKCLAQRNALLKNRAGQAELKPWDQQMAALAGPIDAARNEYFSTLITYFRAFSDFLDGDIAADYACGWNREKDLQAVLEENLDSDMQKGSTQYGPHRADIQIKWNGATARRVVSRGQQKVLALMLILSQIKCFVGETGRQCTVLIDDLDSELDAKHQEWAMAELRQLGQQVVMTGLKSGSHCDGWDSCQLFHVKHDGIHRQE